MEQVKSKKVYLIRFVPPTTKVPELDFNPDWPKHKKHAIVFHLVQVLINTEERSVVNPKSVSSVDLLSTGKLEQRCARGGFRDANNAYVQSSQFPRTKWVVKKCNPFNN